MNRASSKGRYIPLATRLFVLFIIAAVLPLGVSGVFGLTSNYSAQRRQVEALQQEIAANTANEIDAYLEQIEAEMALTAGKWIFDSEASTPGLLQALLTFDRGLETLALVDKAGQETAKLSRYTLFTSQDLNNRASSPDFRAAIKGQRYLGPVSVSQFEEPMVTLAIPVKDPRQDVVGVLVAEVNLKSMWDVVAQVEIGTGGYAYVVDGEGRLIAHRDSSQVLQDQNLRRLPGVAQALLGQAGTSWYAGLEGTDVIGSYQPLQRAGWFVLVESPRREALSNVYQTGALNVAALVATLGLAAILGGYMARNVVRPVRRLQQGARLIGGGDLAHRIEISGRDEIGDLAEAFNGMADQLWQTLKGLERHVTELKRTEAALRESEERYRTIVDGINDAIFIHDVNTGAILDVNQKMCEMYGYTREEARRIDVEVLSSGQAPYTQVEAMAWMQKAREGEPQIFEWHAKDKEGHLFWVEVSIRHAVIAGQNRLLVVVRDITARKQAEKALRDSEEKYRDLVENLSTVIYTVDVNGVITYLSPAVESFLGYHPSEIVGRPFAQLIHQEDLQHLVENHRRILAGQSPKPGESRIRDKSGRIRWMHTSSRPVYEGDRVVGLQGSLLDITDRKQAEEELERYRDHLEELVEERTWELKQAQAELLRQERLSALGQLTATVAHEIRNPLGTVRTAVFAIGDAIERDEMVRVERARQLAERNILRCDRIITELLDYTRDRALNLEPTWVDEWLDELLDEQTVPKDIVYVKELDADIQVAIDREQLRRAVINVLENAVDALQEDDAAGNRLTVSTHVAADQAGSRLEIQVSDTGCGIPPDLMDTVFEPLFSTKAVGVGLGLPIVRSIMQQHGGDIELASKAGEGTTATLWVPITDKENDR